MAKPRPVYLVFFRASRRHLLIIAALALVLMFVLEIVVIFIK